MLLLALLVKYHYINFIQNISTDHRLRVTGTLNLLKKFAI